MDINNFYIEKGNGFPIILLHGNNEDSKYFEPQIDMLSKYYRVIAIDTRGHGNTKRGNKPFTLYQFALDLADFMQEHNIEKAHILGFSDGGNVAIIFSILYPEKVEKLILNGANLYPKGLKYLIRITDKIYYNFLRIFYKNDISKIEMLDLMVNQPNINPDDLSKIKSQTLVIAGTDDMIKQNHTKLIAESISDSELVFIKGNHFISKNNPDEFNKIIIDFLK